LKHRSSSRVVPGSRKNPTPNTSSAHCTVHSRGGYGLRSRFVAKPEPGYIFRIRIHFVLNFQENLDPGCIVSTGVYRIVKFMYVNNCKWIDNLLVNHI